jgi:hypothetical protein
MPSSRGVGTARVSQLKLRLGEGIAVSLATSADLERDHQWCFFALSLLTWAGDGDELRRWPSAWDTTMVGIEAGIVRVRGLSVGFFGKVEVGMALLINVVESSWTCFGVSDGAVFCMCDTPRAVVDCLMLKAGVFLDGFQGRQGDLFGTGMHHDKIDSFDLLATTSLYPSVLEPTLSICSTG